MSGRIAIVFISLFLIVSCGKAAPTTQSSNVVRTFQTAANGDELRLERCVLSPDGLKVAIQLTDVGKKETQIAIYDVPGGQVLYTASGPMDGTFWLAAFSPESSKVAFIRVKARGPSALEVVDLTTGRIVYNPITSFAVGDGGILFNPKGNHIFYVKEKPVPNPDYNKNVYAEADLATGSIVREFKFNQYDGPLQIAADASLLLTYRLEVWDMKTAERVSRLEQEQNYAARATQFLPDGKSVRALDREMIVRTWDASTGKLVSRAQGTGEVPRSAKVGFSRDGSVIYYADTARVFAFDAQTVSPLGSWRPGPQTESMIGDQVRTEEGILVMNVHGPRSSDIAVIRFPPLSQFSSSR